MQNNRGLSPPFKRTLRHRRERVHDHRRQLMVVAVGRAQLTKTRAPTCICWWRSAAVHFDEDIGHGAEADVGRCHRPEVFRRAVFVFVPVLFQLPLQQALLARAEYDPPHLVGPFWRLRQAVYTLSTFRTGFGHYGGEKRWLLRRGFQAPPPRQGLSSVATESWHVLYSR